MSTIRTDITQKKLDDDNEIVTSEDYTLFTSFTEFIRQNMTLQSSAVYQSIQFGQVSVGTCLIIRSDQPITIKLNSGTQEFLVNESFIFYGTTTALELQNNSGETAVISIDIYGG